MELILWRHAEAEMGEPDEGRALTAKGHKQAWKMAEWLDHNLPNSCKILVSPATRTVQTAEALGRKFKIVDDLSPESTVEKILAATNWPDSREPVLVVGHQPALGQLAATLVTGSPQDWTIRKGNVWWIVQRERGDISGNYVRAVMAPDLLTK
ncbi:phosphohistidine phosphatase SixA [Herminiimonas sp. KBW02]|uniref:phosphohistidine phosphatase SixA n=1 Tax=Herminiimonas sp. KBW02 TaxID=2153363 RepID=UPI000F59BC64|nr:phosphohistidine phosphatase SixA [Herminiimonas sp. KBW02]RQO36075.1 phosphohistidine phosphatase SixA [Herminiimonas sp. KBW02]